MNRPLEVRAGRLDELTALRGFAALAVVCLHAMYEWNPVFATGSRYTNLVTGGGLWVHFFFILSGFVIAHAYGAIFASSVDWRDCVRFLWIRFGRVYPLYIVLLLAWIGCESIGWISVRDPPGSLAASVLLVQGFVFGDDVWNYPGWSISAEWLAYCAFPWIAWSLSRLRTSRFPLLFVALSTCIVAVWGTAPGTTEAPWMSAVYCLLEFTLGCVVLTLSRARVADASPRTRLPTWVCILPVLLLALPPNPWSGWILGFAVVCCALTIYTVTVQETGLDRFLQSRAMQFIGVISYSIYLLHALLFRLTKAAVDAAFHEVRVIPRLDPVPALCGFALYLAALVLLAWMTYRWIEEPARLWFKRVAPNASRHLRTEPAR